MQAVTSAPAKLMGQDWRIGHVLPGYDADLVLWDRFPLEIGAKPFRVFTDGLTTYEDVNSENVPFSHQNGSNGEFKSCPSAVTSIRLHNMSNVYASEEDHIEGDVVLIVENGYVTCLGTAEKCPKKDGLLDIDGHGGSLVPVILLFVCFAS
jgi:imidazolonepropionase-like amidohydrolase